MIWPSSSHPLTSEEKTDSDFYTNIFQLAIAAGIKNSGGNAELFSSREAAKLLKHLWTLNTYVIAFRHSTRRNVRGPGSVTEHLCKTPAAVYDFLVKMELSVKDFHTATLSLEGIARRSPYFSDALARIELTFAVDGTPTNDRSSSLS